MKKIALTAFALLALSTASLSAPTVEGNIISWPNDGWYQVQDEQDYAEICGGTRSCTVKDGSYLVINHTTGQRYPGIRVGNGNVQDTSIVVTGNVISWPDDGWYQVQDQSTYKEICSGTRSCKVPPGTYLVINHSSGKRFPGIEVSGDEKPATRIVVTGNVISWPDNGWYQVQNAETYKEVCAGTRSCTVAPGTYLVINHSTGERYEDIKVSGEDAPDTGLAAQRDAARLLTQATFGPTAAQIKRVVELGGPERWIDEQFRQAPSWHLPIVKARFPEGYDAQIGRYFAFWKHAISAEDQLRQRVAFALSEIMVISERSGALFSHGNSLAAYYDILVKHAFGNFRDLMQDVTLSPAMGVYLSMLGNAKPNPRTGQRSDENFAREFMQLFTIGLVKLNRNGLPKEGNQPTYTQSDVENLARIFTGWTWDTPDWNANAFIGWQPDLRTLERPMKAFEEHHDNDAKVLLGNRFPAGQSAQQDLSQAMDLLFRHPNVGPFISRQLIQRLVTSNPKPAYVSRVAAVFNNNGEGVRGDLGAVVRAILLDRQARDSSIASQSDYGKLREPVLRLSHLWRAFKMRDPINMRYNDRQLSQHAPLTARSVFNFFSPSFSPPGVIRQSGLVAPEFQINSETRINYLNSALMVMIQGDRFYNLFPARLNLDVERSLLDSPDRLINRLDLLLFAGSMSDNTRDILSRYIETNIDSERVERERLLRDVISLAFLSADYTVQR